ncbi:MAG TPA: tetratricopeptide repeat protein [Thermoanaerobaculia bacterium]|jgi:Tfp pilus assembly protein PilF|nr:tetratricopeptide repeat protein [Thermoanaerobaculia bacterium]
MPRSAFALALLLSLPAAAQPADHLSFFLQTRPLRGLQGPIATLLTTGQEGGGLPMAALAVPSGESDGRFKGEARFAVPLLVEIEGNGLLSGGRKDVQRIEIYAYAMGPDGAVNDYLAQGLSLDLAEVGEAVLDSGIKFVGTVTMPAGTGSLRVLVVDPDTLRYSLRVLPLTVPSASAGPLLLPPLFSDPRGRWVLARPGEAAEGLERSLAPLLLDEGWGLPSSLPLLSGGRKRRVVLLGRGLPAEPSVTLEIRTEAGKQVLAVPGTVIERSQTSGLAPERLVCDFDLPKLETGRYRASVAMAGMKTPELTVLYLSENPLNEEPIWAQLRRLGGESAPIPVATAEAPKGRRRNAEMERIARQGYEEALRGLASGTPLDQVVSRLGDMEAGLYRQSPQSAEALREVELETAQRLGKGDPEVLLPLSLLHAELYRSLRERKEIYLAESARRTSADLAAAYVERGGSESVAAQALLSLAADLLASGVQSASRSMLDRALALDGRNEAVGLFLAASAERDGDYPRAADVLERLVQAHPDSAEGRLRLGVNLDRVGKAAQARETLQRLISEPVPEWVKTVAFQEMVRLQLQDGRQDRAVALLRQAVARLPNQTQLAVQLAYLLERQGSASAAREILARVKPRPQATDGSPRHRYGQWPTAALDEVRRSLTQQSILRLAALARALGES